MKKQTGIWLDLRNAWVINLPVAEDSVIVTEHIASGIEEHATINVTRMDGSSRPHGGNNQRTVEERLHHEEQHYFADILHHIHPSTDELVIFGPSEAKYGLKKWMEDQLKAPLLVGVEAADQMSEPQMEAWVRHYFGRPAARKLPNYGSVHP